MLAPDKLLGAIKADEMLYWDYCFLIMWLVVVGLGVCAIMSAIMTEQHIVDFQQKCREQDKKNAQKDTK
ncbi:MAG: hypothetical protein ACHQ1D_00875 [Nitrososphaerales archaeon]